MGDITRRDLFIAAALQGLLAHHGSAGDEEEMAVFAFRYGAQTELQVADDDITEADRAAAARLLDELKGAA